MKVIILAGGYGSRLGTITNTLPKPMVRIGERPILWHIMRTYAHYGHKDFIISCGYRADVIKDYFLNFDTYNYDFTVDLDNMRTTLHADPAERGWRVTVADTGLNTLKGARIKRIERYLDDVNMVTYGDGVADINIDSLLEFHQRHGRMLTVTGVHPPSRFGEIVAADGRVMNFEEKAQTSAGLINGGYMVFNREFLDYLNIDEDCDLETEVMRELTRRGEVMVYEHPGQWACVDHERDMIYLNRLWKENKAFWEVWREAVKPRLASTGR